MRTVLALIMAALLICALCACADTTAEDLYALPQLSDRYLVLQNTIDQMLASGAEYAAPVSGYHRQAIQMEDLDGDGVGEVMAFFNVLGSDRPLKIYIFRQTEDGYEQVGCVEGEGSGFDSVNYIDMDGDGVKEITVGWQMVSGMNMLSVYTSKGFEPLEIINTDYTEYITCALGDDDRSDLVALRLSGSDLTGEAVYYSLTDDGEILSSTARLSNGTEALLRVRSTTLTDGADGVLIESRSGGGGIVTDILTLDGGQLVNITLNEASGQSEDTYRMSEVYCRDIDGDGTLDVPVPVALPSLSETTAYYRIEWYSYSGSGRRSLVMNTYNNSSDGWYFILPDQWVDRIAVRRVDGVSGERAIAFSIVDGDGQIGDDFLIIYKLTGENRAERAAYAGRFVLHMEEDTIYAASIRGDGQSLGIDISEELVTANFQIIYSEWLTGDA